MNRARNLGVTTTIALLLTVALGGCSAEDPTARPDPTPVADDAKASPAVERPVDLQGLQGPLEPGTYSLVVWGAPRRAVFEVPAGFFSNGGWVIDAGSDGTSEWDQYGTVQVYAVDRVLTDPCRRRTATDPGPTVRDLARALIRQSGPSTRPTPIALDGHKGVSMEVFVPPDIDLATCTDGEYPLWLADGDILAHSDRPGIIHHLRILDVDGTRLVVVASIHPGQPSAQNEELIAIAESVHFEPTTRS